MARRSLQETWRYLEREGEQMPYGPGGLPFVPASMPGADDEGPLGFSYYKQRREDVDNSHLTLPRTFFDRSLLSRVNFAGTDLSESRMCWNDFVDCDFSGADLSRCDMRASIFKRCKFTGATLRGADLRRSSFEDCDFTEADVTGALAEAEDAIACIQDYLSEQQQAAISWQPDDGPEPPGG